VVRRDTGERPPGTESTGGGAGYYVMEGREFKQLLSAVERTRLSLHTDLVKQAHNEFLAEDYEEAKSKLQTFCAEFERAAASWLQKYREKMERYDRERGAFTSHGKWQAEQAADRVTTEKINSARRMLTLVMGGLEAMKAARQKN
jgi:hypothetical protein